MHVRWGPPQPRPSPFLCVPHLLVTLTGYNDTEQENNRECSVGKYFVQDDTEEQMKEACRFKRDVLSLCSGLSDTNFGYSEGRPCVLLKMNRVKAIVRLSVPALLASLLTCLLTVVSQIIGLMPRGDPYINCTIKVNTPSDGDPRTRYLFRSLFFLS